MYYMSINKNLSGTHNTNPSHKKKKKKLKKVNHVHVYRGPTTMGENG